MTKLVNMSVAETSILIFNTSNKYSFVLNGYINGNLNNGKSGALFRLPDGYTFETSAQFYMQYNDGTAPISLGTSNGTDLVFPVLTNGAIRVWGISL